MGVEPSDNRVLENIYLCCVIIFANGNKFDEEFLHRQAFTRTIMLTQKQDDGVGLSGAKVSWERQKLLETMSRLQDAGLDTFWSTACYYPDIL